MNTKENTKPQSEAYRSFIDGLRSGYEVIRDTRQKTEKLRRKYREARRPAAAG